MKLLKQINEGFSKQQLADMNKLCDQYKEEGFSPAEVQEMAGDDLEMLEYSPEDVEVMVPYIMKKCK